MTQDTTNAATVWASRAIGAFAKDDEAEATYERAVFLRIEAGCDFAKMAHDWKYAYGDMEGWPAHLEGIQKGGARRARRLIAVSQDLGPLLAAGSEDLRRRVLESGVFQQLERLPRAERVELSESLEDGTKTPEDLAEDLKKRERARKDAKRSRETKKLMQHAAADLAAELEAERKKSAEHLKAIEEANNKPRARDAREIERLWKVIYEQDAEIKALRKLTGTQDAEIKALRKLVDAQEVAA